MAYQWLVFANHLDPISRTFLRRQCLTRPGRAPPQPEPGRANAHSRASQSTPPKTRIAAKAPETAAGAINGYGPPKLPEEAEMKWKGLKASSLAFWLRHIAKALIALDEGQERLESDIGALSDEVYDHAEPDELDIATEDTIDLTAAPHVLNFEVAFSPTPPSASASCPSQTPALLANGSSGHAATSDPCPARPAAPGDLRDHAIRLMNRHGCHCLRRCRDS